MVRAGVECDDVATTPTEGSGPSRCAAARPGDLPCCVEAVWVRGSLPGAGVSNAAAGDRPKPPGSTGTSTAWTAVGGYSRGARGPKFSRVVVAWLRSRGCDSEPALPVLDSNEPAAGYATVSAMAQGYVTT